VNIVLAEVVAVERSTGALAEHLEGNGMGVTNWTGVLHEFERPIENIWPMGRPMARLWVRSWLHSHITYIVALNEDTGSLVGHIGYIALCL
jgi:hypothetical protein